MKMKNLLLQIDNTTFVYDERIGFTKSSPKVTDSGMVICEVNGTRIKEFQLHVNREFVVHGYWLLSVTGVV